jgi:hypothetical protein
MSYIVILMSFTAIPPSIGYGPTDRMTWIQYCFPNNSAGDWARKSKNVMERQE